ncbi:5'-nucleotidase /3'-nucleotidase /exopolyphosphatase [Hymenobacter daecheongensis DSM 21074]|uniref:5'-nucleotidase SurE n=1 Tax=Hymenobacter daecheongensis DSM 21074 TaxID=1121955 RepID=A0A1M6JPI0_9BACT|nr:5'/3'-nucleotidase SurE [Hymenobacter daecheongensis]SHJ48513.1 5'-nucleotidase /3'-nucleotidase /exopolyphosphatase [Hymenobacter daecheongensis DSM 21074]
MAAKPRKPLILISNDDGITAPGIATLVRVMRRIGEVVVVAPNSPQSGMGHAITIGSSLRLDPSTIFEGIEAYECSGTPADCVKLAKHFVLKDRRPDIVVSGINHGSNSSVNVLYSGTMSAAIEAAIEGLPAIGFSLCDYGHLADFSHTEEWIEHLTRQALKNGIPAGTALNVNIPKKSAHPIKGARLCRQARAKWQENFDLRYDPHQRPYYWLIGNFVNEDQGEDTDEVALANNYISIVPCQFDLTALHGLAEMNESWTLDLAGRKPATNPVHEETATDKPLGQKRKKAVKK